MRTLAILAVLAIAVAPAVAYNPGWPGDALYWGAGTTSITAAGLNNAANWNWEAFVVDPITLIGSVVTSAGHTPSGPEWACLDIGDVTVTGGAAFVDAYFFMASNASDTASLTLQAGSDVGFAVPYMVDNGTGTLTVDAGARMYSTGTDAIQNGAGSMIIDIQGTYDSAGQINVGHTGDGTMYVGGQVTTDGRTWLGNGAAANGLVQIQAGGEFEVTNNGHPYGAAHILVGRSGTGEIQIQTGGTLDMNLAALGGGYALYVGDVANGGVGVLDIQAGATADIECELVLTANGTLKYDAAGAAVSVEGWVTLDGALEVSGSLGPAGWVTLIDGNAGFTGPGFTSITPGYSVQVVGSTLQLIPEPATMALLGLGVVGLLRRRRR